MAQQSIIAVERNTRVTFRVPRPLAASITVSEIGTSIAFSIAAKNDQRAVESLDQLINSLSLRRDEIAEQLGEALKEAKSL